MIMTKTDFLFQELMFKTLLNEKLIEINEYTEALTEIKLQFQKSQAHMDELALDVA